MLAEQTSVTQTAAGRDPETSLFFSNPRNFILLAYVLIHPFTQQSNYRYLEANSSAASPEIPNDLRDPKVSYRFHKLFLTGKNMGVRVGAVG